MRNISVDNQVMFRSPDHQFSQTNTRTSQSITFQNLIFEPIEPKKLESCLQDGPLGQDHRACTNHAPMQKSVFFAPNLLCYVCVYAKKVLSNLTTKVKYAKKKENCKKNLLPVKSCGIRQDFFACFLDKFLVRFGPNFLEENNIVVTMC